MQRIQCLFTKALISSLILSPLTVSHEEINPFLGILLNSHLHPKERSWGWGVPTALGMTHPCPAWLELLVPLAVGNTRDLLRGAAEEEEGESQEQAEEHAEDTHGAALPQGHLEPLQDGTTHHDPDHRPRDVHSTWGKASPVPCFPSSEPYHSLHYSEGPEDLLLGSYFSASVFWKGPRFLQGLVE